MHPAESPKLFDTVVCVVIAQHAYTLVACTAHSTYGVWSICKAPKGFLSIRGTYFVAIPVRHACAMDDDAWNSSTGLLGSTISQTISHDMPYSEESRID